MGNNLNDCTLSTEESDTLMQWLKEATTACSRQVGYLSPVTFQNFSGNITG